MIQGTTPLHIFKLPFSVDLIQQIRVIYSQNDKPVFVKVKEDCTLEDKTVRCKLTQKDTFALNEDQPVKIQVRVLTTSGDALSCHTKTVSIEECLEEEEMT